MERIEISLEQLEHRYLNIKDGVVFRSFSKIYKYNPDSKEIMDVFDSIKDSKYGKNMSLAQSYMYYRDIYIGYVMKYYWALRNIQNCIKKWKIDAYRFFNELIELVQFLNEHGICYWDFHLENIRVDAEGHPFLLDLDGADLNPTDEDKHYQSEYLSGFILNQFLGESKSTCEYIGLLEDRGILSDKAIRYLKNTGNLIVDDIPLPYVVLEEIKSREVQNEIKRLIK